MSVVWLNGQFVSLDDAKVSAFDAGFQHAVGLFETMRARGGRVFRVEHHLERLETSARELNLTERLHIEPLRNAIEHTLERAELIEARVRLTLTGGDLNLRRVPETGAPKRSQDPTILIHAQPLQQYPPEFFDRGVTVTIANDRLNPLDSFAGHKTLNYWPRLAALQAAGAVGASEALWFTVSNHLAGGSVSNVFLVKDGELLTPIARGEEGASTAGNGSAGPVLASPVLPGITRGFVFDAADERAVPVHRRMLDINDLLGADEVFLSNSGWGVLPVTHVERETIASGAPGPITDLLRQAWLAAVQS